MIDIPSGNNRGVPCHLRDQNFSIGSHACQGDRGVLGTTHMVHRDLSGPSRIRAAWLILLAEASEDSHARDANSQDLTLDSKVTIVLDILTWTA